jgi:hypothetical protein
VGKIEMQRSGAAGVFGLHKQVSIKYLDVYQYLRFHLLSLPSYLFKTASRQSAAKRRRARVISSFLSEPLCPESV